LERDDVTTFDATTQSDDLAVIYCLRALAKFSAKDGNNNMPVKGTGDAEWQRDDHRVTFRFASENDRSRFLGAAERLLPRRWSVPTP
jgi:hypothetical protein